jgi:uncharacterized protein YdbL (DUF1318 family)
METGSHPSRRSVAASLVLAVMLAPGIAPAQTPAAKALVDAAKAAGKVGEQADGFLGFVMPQTDPALEAAVAEINAGRRRAYEETARRNGDTPEVAGVAAFKVLRDTKLKPGDYFRDADGVWRRK